MKLKQTFLRTALLWTLLGVLMVLSQPTRLPVIILIVPFVLLFMALMSSWSLIQALQRRFAAKGTSPRPVSRRLKVTVCSSLVLVLVLQSLGQLTFKDVATIGAIALIAYLYVGRGLIEPKKR